MADIFKEVDEDLRRDQAVDLWRKYGRHIIAVAVVAVLATGGYQLWSTWTTKRQTERSDIYAAALSLVDQGDSDAALAEFDKLSEADGSYGTLAAFNQARLLLESGDTAGAIAVWDELAASDDTGAAFRGMATLLAVLHQIESGDPEALRARLEPFTELGNGFRPSALELLAVLAMRQGDQARARELYTEIADDRNAPLGLRGRAAQMLVALEE